MKEPMYIRKAETESIRGDRIILYYFTVETRGKDADGSLSYGIGVDMYTQLPGERTIRERKISDSVFSSKEEAEKLVDIISRCTVTPTTLCDVVKDYTIA